MEWLLTNKEWIFSGVGVSVVLFVLSIINRKTSTDTPQQQPVQNNLSVSINKNMDSSHTTQNESTEAIEQLKIKTSILFIDDDRTFKIVDILKKMGWINTTIIKDVNSISDQNIVNADVLFIDIQGVGKLLQLKDEGLGLALAIKRRYKNKKIIIYSAQEEGARFHEALSEADYSLPKTAEPVRFEETILKVVKP